MRVSKAYQPISLPFIPAAFSKTILADFSICWASSFACSKSFFISILTVPLKISANNFSPYASWKSVKAFKSTINYCISSGKPCWNVKESLLIYLFKPIIAAKKACTSAKCAWKSRWLSLSSSLLAISLKAVRFSQRQLITFVAHSIISFNRLCLYSRFWMMRVCQIATTATPKSSVVIIGCHRSTYMSKLYHIQSVETYAPIEIE